jgi:hypothetical protein
LLGSSALASRAILGEKGVHIQLVQVLYAYDVVGTSVRARHNYLPESLGYDPPLQMKELRKIYDPHTSFFLYWGEPGPRRLTIEMSQSAIDALARSWIEAIRSEPWSYARHRIVLFLAHLGIGKGTPWRKLEFPATRDEFGGHEPYWGPTVFGTPQNRWLTGMYRAAGGTTFSSSPGELWAKDTGLLFRPWPYLLLSLLCVLAAWRTRNAQRFQIALLGTSSLLYIAPHLVISVSSDFRYMLWPILVSLLQPILLADGMLRGSESGSHVERSPDVSDARAKSPT